MESARDNIVGFAALFTSLGTLVCCALPALFVTLGAGAALAGLVSAFPQLIWLSEHKALVFGLAGAAILASGWLQWKNRNAPCPVDPAAARSCMKARKFSRGIFWLSGALYLTGFFFAFIARYIF
jgi:hypothetical protein